MTYKRFAYGLVVVLAAFILTNYLIWKNFTEILLNGKYAGGDLARMAYFLGSKDYRNNSYDLLVKHFEMKDYKGQHVDVLTIGDSFSQGAGGGKNPFYQDYIATLNNFAVLNVYPYPTDDLVAFFQPLSTLKVLYTSGYLDIIKPRVVLIESVERYCVERYSKPFTLGRTENLERVRDYYYRTEMADVNALPKVTFINEGNFKFVYYNLLYKLSFNPVKRKIIMAKLDRPLFSVKDNDRLLFYHEDIDHMKSCDTSSMTLLNDNFNAMAELLGEKGIELYFMPIVDKYDLLSRHIVNNPYPESRFFDILRTLPKKYRFIDTKAILTETLDKGEKDIYYADDTHWSWKAARTVFEQVKFE